MGTDLGGSSARTRHCFLSQNRPKPKPIEAGRSLLKKQVPSIQQTTTNNMADKHKTILDDHCYFLARPSHQKASIKPLKGMLTPNESSEDEEPDTSDFNTGTTTIVTNNVDKRKIAEAVQSLIKNRPDQASANVHSSNNIKFKFRMKFKSTQAANSMKKAASALHQTVDQEDLRRERRKSASRNAYCPPPSMSKENRSPLKIRHHKQAQQQSLLANSHKKMAEKMANMAAAS